MTGAGLHQMLVLWAYPVLLCMAIGTDLARRLIPNLLVAALIIAFLGAAWLMPLPDLKVRLVMAGGVTGLGFLLFSQDIVGAGDAKLAGTLALWVDPVLLPLFVAACGLIGGALALMAMGGTRMDTAAAAAPETPPAALPYAVALAGAGLILHPYSSLMLGT